MRSWMALLALVSACGFGSNSNGGGDDGGTGTKDALVCYGTFLSICFPAAPAAPRALTTMDIDTDSSSACDATAEQRDRYCVIAGSPLTLAAGETIRARGGKPLVLVSTGTAMVNVLGDIDVSSHRTGAQIHGAGADPSDPGMCTFMTAASLGGGGYGGSFGSKGGDGSDSRPPSVGNGVAGAAITSFPTTLRGGCPGGNGGLSNSGGVEGHGGDGGGAVAIIATALVYLDGNIDASGSGGHGALGPAVAPLGGGGGGGSGGMILIESSVPLSFGLHVQFWANGGGGAQGGALNTAGSDGSESAAPTQVGVRSSGPGVGANGGDGAYEGNAAGNGRGAGDGGGGGGGGGGVGVIHAPGVTDMSIISPPSSGP